MYDGDNDDSYLTRYGQDVVFLDRPVYKDWPAEDDVTTTG